MTTHQDPDILAQPEHLNLKTDNNTAITQLAEIVRYQVIQAERDRLNFKNNFNNLTTINQQAATDHKQAAIDKQTLQNNIAEISQHFQTEIRRIWEYVYFSQGRNGSVLHKNSCNYFYNVTPIKLSYTEINGLGIKSFLVHKLPFHKEFIRSRYRYLVKTVFEIYYD